MKRKKDGDVFIIPLMPYLDKVIYAKYVNVRKYVDGASYPDLLVFYLDYNCNELIEKSLFCMPKYITGGSGLIQMYQLHTNDKVSESERQFPLIRKCSKIWGDYINCTEWDVIDARGQKLNSKPYLLEDVLYLDSVALICPISRIPFLLSAIYCKEFDLEFVYNHDLDYIQNIMIGVVNQIPKYRDIRLKSPVKMWMKI